nr:hypothetical protein [Actinomadura hallensis]
MGTAKPRPIPATAVLTPTTRPRESARAPPELPGLRGGVGLDDVLDDADGGAGAGALRGRQGPAERRDHPGGHRPRKAEGVADRDDQLADHERVAVSERDRVGDGAVGAHDRQVRQRVGADDGERAGLAVGEGGVPAGRGADDVGVGEQEPVAGERDGRAGALAAAVPHAQRGHARGQLAGDGGHRPGVGVQRRLAAGGIGDHANLPDDYIVTR